MEATNLDFNIERQRSWSSDVVKSLILPTIGEGGAGEFKLQIPLRVSTKALDNYWKLREAALITFDFTYG